MSQGQVRQAIAAYLNGGIPASLPGFNHCYLGQPSFIDPTKWWQVPAELGAGTLGWLHLALVDEDRIADPAVAGQKLVEYTVALPLIYRYPIPSASQSPQLQGDEWVLGWDATVEALKAFLRADPNLGTGSQGVIWQAAQSKGDLSITAGDMPVRDENAGEILNFGVLEFHVTEVITA